jgi:hypothetical protein
MKNNRSVLPLFALCALLASCATSIPVYLTKPALIDMGGIRKIAVLPFGYSGDGYAGSYLEAAIRRSAGSYRYRSTDEQQIATNITDSMNEVLLDSKAYAVISPVELARLAATGQSFAVAADGYLTGEITLLAVSHRDGDEEVKGDDGKMVSTHFVERELRLEFVYRVIRSSDGSILGQARKSGRAADKKYGSLAREMLRSEVDLARQVIADQMSGVPREVAPWQTTEYRSLERDAAKDQRMKDADSLVRQGRYQDARAIFSAVYAENGNFAAGFDDAIMTEILGDLDGAIGKMGALADSSGNPKARKELGRMKRTLADAERLKRGR